MENLLLKIDRLNDIIHNAPSEEFIFEDLFDGFKNIFSVEIVLLDKNGRVFYKAVPENFSLFGNDFREVPLNNFFKNINIIDKSIFSEYYAEGYSGIVMPVAAAGKRLGSIILYKKECDFDNACLIAAEYLCMTAGFVFLNIDDKEDREVLRKHEIVRSAMGTLSFSELEAVLNVFDELDGNEGLLVASRVADKAKITRSVIVNALRKLESAGIIESRSLGMKGTYIKVLNESLIEEITKLKK